MDTMQIRLLGRFSVQRDRQTMAGLGGLKVQELLCYLLLYRGRSQPRKGLAALLWGDVPTAQSRKYLRQALWQLQSALDTQRAPAGDSLLMVEPDWVRINPDVGLWLDVAEFEHASALSQGVSGAELEPSVARLLRQAVELYRGDLLEGWCQDWCLCERERLQDMHMAMLDKLMDHGEAHGEFEAGLAYGQRILRYDRARERTHRHMMRLHYLAGDRSEALRQYDQCVAALQEELGVNPARLTADLREQIRADRLDVAGSPFTRGAVAGSGEPRLADLLSHLVLLRGTLSNLQLQLQREIQRLQGTAGDPL